MNRWGGARRGAGRPKRGPIASEPHKTRPALSPSPIHVVARVVRTAGALHDRRARRAIEHALTRTLARADFRIVHLAVVTGRLELVVEATDRISLARGMQGFQVAAAKLLNRLRGRHGTVFADRYRARPLIGRAAVRAIVGASHPRKTPTRGRTCRTYRTYQWPESMLLARPAVRFLVELLMRPGPTRDDADRYPRKSSRRTTRT
jgi:hypothetical protein